MRKIQIINILIISVLIVLSPMEISAEDDYAVYISTSDVADMIRDKDVEEAMDMWMEEYMSSDIPDKQDMLRSLGLELKGLKFQELANTPYDLLAPVIQVIATTSEVSGAILNIFEKDEK